MATAFKLGASNQLRLRFPGHGSTGNQQFGRQNNQFSRYWSDRHGVMNSAAATTIRQRLEALKPQVLEVATRHGASNLRIYGSIATGHEHSGSDLDLLVELPKGQSLLGLISLRQDLEDLLGCSVDVTEAENLHPLIRTQILEQALAL